jgi:WD40 repeat protein
VNFSFDAPENYYASVSPDADFLAFALPGNDLRVFKTERKFQDLPKLDGSASWHSEAPFNTWKFSADSSQIAVSYGRMDWVPPRKRTVSLLDVPRLEHVDTIPVPDAWEFAFTPDGKRMAIATRTGLTLWDISKRAIVWEAKQTEVIQQIVFSPDGRLVAGGAENRLVTIRNVSDGTTRIQLNSHRDRIRSIAFSPDGKTLATAADAVVKLWHVPSGQELFELTLPQTSSHQVAFSTDGNHLLWNFSPWKSDKHEIAVFDATFGN